MKKKDIINGIEVILDDGDADTAHIIDCSESPELCKRAEKERLQFVRRQLEGFGKNKYMIVDRKTGKEVKEI